MVPTFDLDAVLEKRGLLGLMSTTTRSWKPKFFHNFENCEPDRDELLVDVALKTSAAPTFFPSYGGFIDGGVIANNPAICAYAQALAAGTQSPDITVLSIGTGLSPSYIEGDVLNWGVLQWAPHVTQIMLDGGIDCIDFQCERILGKRYHRVNPILPEPIELDDTSKIGRLIEIADALDLEQTVEWVRNQYN